MNNRIIQGTVQGTSADYQRLAVLTVFGYTVMDIIDGQADIGDRLNGCQDDH